MKNMFSIRSILYLLLLINSIHLSQATIDEEERKLESLELPLIWSERRIGRGESEQSYRFTGEIQLADSDKWYLFEEWGSLTKKKFKFDLIEAPTGKRRTLLAYEESGEKFVYQPFTCSLVYNLNDELYEGLKNKFPPSQQDRLLSTGIGSIWMHAKRIKQIYVGPTCVDCKYERAAVRSSKQLEDLRKYTMVATADYPYEVDFYFRTDRPKDEPKTLVVIRLTDSSNKVVMVVKMLDYEQILPVNPNGPIGVDMDTFDLPLGYGCPRGAKFEHFFAVPIDILGNRVHPHILRLNIVSLQPQNEEDDMEKWKTHSMSVKIVAGRLPLEFDSRDYLMLETQEYAPGQGQDELDSCSLNGSKACGATLKRTRRVWDLGAEGLSVGSANSLAVYFEIDEKRAKCLGSGELDVKDAAEIQFPVAPSESQRKQPGSNQTSANQYKVPGLILNNELMGLLFSATDDYHLIQELSQGRRKEFIYERRQLEFKLRDKRGKELWSGPVSLIKRQSINVNDFRRNKKQSPLEISSGVTIQFLSKDLEKFVSKITILLADKQSISRAALHRELNIATLCYSSPEVTNQDQMVDFGLSTGAWNYKRRERKSNNLEISLTYPIECDDEADESTTRPPSSLINNTSPSPTVGSCKALKKFLESPRLAESVIYEQFLSSLFRTMRGRLDPIQLSQVGVLMSPQLDALRVSAKLVSRPSLLAFSESQGQRFARARRNHIHAELKPSKVACADSCQHLNCISFVYCPYSNECDLCLDDDENIYIEDRKHLLYEPDASCSLFRPARGRQTDIMSPQEVREELRRLVEEEPVLLGLKLQDLNEQGQLITFLQLIPQRFESSLIAQNDLFNAMEPERTSDGMIVVEEEKQDLVVAEYELVALNYNYKSKKKALFKAHFPIDLAKRMSYQGCESLCNELDCQSFSHCQLEQTCQVSKLRKGNEILEASEPEDFCSIFGRDYLSKFTKNLKLKSGQLLVELSKSLDVTSAHDCALHCMEESEFKCRSFYACSEMAPSHHGQSNIDCHLRRSHLSGGASEIRKGSDQEEHSAALRPNVTCHLYTRSYLAEFDRFYKRALADDGSTRTQLFRNIGAEGCGLECAERLGSCWAFQVCRPQITSGARQGPICTLSLVATVTNQSNPSASPPGSGPTPALADARDWLVANERCTTFVVSARSELASLPVRAKLAEGHFDETFSSSGKRALWGLWPLALLVGLALGLVVGRLRRPNSVCATT